MIVKKMYCKKSNCRNSTPKNNPPPMPNNPTPSCAESDTTTPQPPPPTRHHRHLQHTSTYNTSGKIKFPLAACSTPEKIKFRPKAKQDSICSKHPPAAVAATTTLPCRRRSVVVPKRNTLSKLHIGYQEEEAPPWLSSASPCSSILRYTCWVGCWIVGARGGGASHHIAGARGGGSPGGTGHLVVRSGGAGEHREEQATWLPEHEEGGHREEQELGGRHDLVIWAAP
jgi:hypothetical protein